MGFGKLQTYTRLEKLGEVSEANATGYSSSCERLMCTFYTMRSGNKVDSFTSNNHTKYGTRTTHTANLHICHIPAVLSGEYSVCVTGPKQAKPLHTCSEVLGIHLSSKQT